MGNKINNNNNVFTPFKSQSKLSDEMKKKCIGMSDSLFKSEKNGDDGSEKILSSNGKDRRIEVPIEAYDDNYKNKIYNIVLLRMVFNNNPYTGTGTIIGRESDYIYILTCAHNVMSYDKDLDEKVEATKVAFTVNRLCKFNVEESESYAESSYVIHPKYLKNPTPSSGNDLAIIKVKINKNDKKLSNIVPIRLRRIDGDITSYSAVKVMGYPGDKYDGDVLFGMSGDYNLQKKNTLVTYKQIDTSGGQSGGPIFSHEDNKSNDDKDIFTKFGEIVGVHTGGRLDMGKNWGTALNKEKLKWIYKVLPSTAMPKVNNNNVNTEEESYLV